VAALTRSIEENLRASRRFKLFERATNVLQAGVMKEQEFAKSDRALRDAAAFGQMNNIELVVQPILTRVAYDASSAPVPELPGRTRHTAAVEAELTVKIVDTTSAQIKYQTSLTARRTSSQVGARDGAPDPAAVWSALSAEIGGTASNRIIDSVFPIEVVQQNAKSIFINRGEGAVAVGDRFELFSAGEPLVDPKTKMVLGVEETSIGHVVVRRVNEKFSIAEPDGALTQAAKAGDILRPADK
jgi:hypothetical protein